MNCAPEIKHALTDVRGVLEQLGILGEGRARQKQAGGWMIRCPVHTENTPSCSVQLRDGVLLWNCHACERGGDVLTLIAAVRGLTMGHDFPQVLAEGARMAGLWAIVDELEGRAAPQVPRAAPVRPAPAPEPDVDVDLIDRVYSAVLEACPLHSQRDVAGYVEQRGVYADAEAVGCGALPRPGDGQEQLLEQLARAGILRQQIIDAGLMKAGQELAPSHPYARLLIPWRGPDGKLNCLQRRRVDGAKPKYVFPTGIAPTAAFGSDLLAPALGFLGRDAEVAIVEGAIDALSRRRIARHRDERVAVIAISSAGAALVGLPLDLLRGRRVRISVDTDAMGEKATADLVKALGDVAAELVRERPAGVKDWNEALAAGASR